MKKIIILTIVIAFASAFSNIVKAQATQAIEVTATVLQVFAFTSVTNVSFGNVQAGSVAEINANASDGTADSNAGTPVSGAVTITGGAQNYTIQQTTAPVLSNGTQTLTFTPRYYASTNNLTSAITGSGHPVTGGGAITLDIGGQLQSPSVAGSYTTASGTGAQNLVLTVSYTGL